jgi:predicted secreted acid phosphatase
MRRRIVTLVRSASRAALVAAIAVTAACATAGAPPTPSAVPSLVDAKRQVTEYVSSGRYEADITAVVADAKAYLAGRLSGGAKLAIVLDIDETALTNLPALRANDYAFIIGGPCELSRGPCGFVAWLELARAEPIRPVLELARFARERGVGVFLITGRPERFRPATETNLRAAGYEWTGVILKPNELVTSSAVEFKALERRKLVEQGWVIAVNVGDQLSDLDGGYAERTYKLPNPFYFVP